MIIHTPGSVKKFIDPNRAYLGLEVIDKATVVTYRDNMEASLCDQYGATVVNNGKKHNSEKMYDVCKYIIDNPDIIKDYVCIIDCNDVIIHNEDIDKMISGGYDLYISHYYRMNEIYLMRGAFVNSGCIFGNKKAMLKFAEVYTAVYKMSSGHHFDEGLVAAAILTIMCELKINVSNDYIKTINIINLKDEYMKYKHIFVDGTEKQIYEIDKQFGFNVARYKHDGRILKI